MASISMRRMTEARKLELVRRYLDSAGGTITAERRERAERYLRRQDEMQQQQLAEEHLQGGNTK
eukprot:12034052-Prorocentrum_lima.AAC.1